MIVKLLDGVGILFRLLALFLVCYGVYTWLALQNSPNLLMNHDSAAAYSELAMRSFVSVVAGLILLTQMNVPKRGNRRRLIDSH
jgi:Na+/proline symporter